MTVTSEQREAVRLLAGGCCEYCRVREEDRYSKFQVDHIVPRKHGGGDTNDNLCLACLKCNSFKGPNVAALDPDTGDATKLYHPRRQIWEAHFRINPDGTLTGLSPEGRATIEVLRINEASRIKNRLLAVRVGRYPCQAH